MQTSSNLEGIAYTLITIYSHRHIQLTLTQSWGIFQCQIITSYWFNWKCIVSYIDCCKVWIEYAGWGWIPCAQ